MNLFSDQSGIISPGTSPSTNGNSITVPILPDFLLLGPSSSAQSVVGGGGGGVEIAPANLLYKKYDFEFVSKILVSSAANSSLNAPPPAPLQVHPSTTTTTEDENVWIGVLLSTKAFVQLAFNPIIGVATKRIGYSWPILLGTVSLLVSSGLFAVGDNYYSLLLARAVQGIGSSCLGVCGISLVATLYPEDDKRSRVMGVVLGSVALGVLIGYPVGGIFYDFVGKSSPFWILCVLLVLVLCVQVHWLPLSHRDALTDTEEAKEANWRDLLSDFEINLISLAIFISTSAMAILEPCLPLFLLTNLHPERWQLGTVFIPDSLGYLIGTNGFGRLAFELGQIRVAVVALIVIGGSCITVRALVIREWGVKSGFFPSRSPDARPWPA